MSAPIALGHSISLPLSPLSGDNSLTRPLREEVPENARQARVSSDRTVQRVDRSKADPQNVKAGEGMEAMFLDYMYKTMRQTVPKNEMDLESSATEIYRSMQDSENAQKAAKMGGIGLADTIIAYLESSRYNSNQGHAVPKTAYGMSASPQKAPSVEPIRGASTGGTHEGQ